MDKTVFKTKYCKTTSIHSLFTWCGGFIDDKPVPQCSDYMLIKQTKLEK